MSKNKPHRQQTQQPKPQETETKVEDKKEEQQPTEETKVESVEQKKEEPVKQEEQKKEEPKTEEKVEDKPAPVEQKTEVKDTRVKNDMDAVSILEQSLESYAKEMAPGIRQTNDSIVRHQMTLHRIVNSVLSLTENDFHKGMKMLVRIVRENRKGAFSDRHAMRGFERLRLSHDQLVRFESLMSLLMSAADMENPKAVKKVVDFKVLFRSVTDNEQQQRLQEYFSA